MLPAENLMLQDPVTSSCLFLVPYANCLVILISRWSAIYYCVCSYLRGLLLVTHMDY
jgi:hypothetical protein